MIEAKQLEDKVLKYWNNLSEDDLKKNRKDLLAEMAKKLNMPEEILEKTIGDWEAGKGS